MLGVASVSIQIDAVTLETLERLAAELNTTVSATVALAVRALRQDPMCADQATGERAETFDGRGR